MAIPFQRRAFPNQDLPCRSSHCKLAWLHWTIRGSEHLKQRLRVLQLIVGRSGSQTYATRQVPQGVIVSYLLVGNHVLIHTRITFGSISTWFQCCTSFLGWFFHRNCLAVRNHILEYFSIPPILANIDCNISIWRQPSYNCELTNRHAIHKRSCHH